MAEGELLGVAVLELKTDDRQLNAGMARARLKAEQETARMQTSVDRRMAAISAAMSTVSHSADQMAASFERAAIAQDAVAGASDKATEAFARETVAIRALTAATDDLAASRAAAAAAGAGVNAKHVFYHSDPAKMAALGGGSAAGGGGGGLRSALYGRGRFGAAAPLTLGAFAGLGVEHILTTALAIAGSAAAGAAGGGLLALGAGGQMAVGGGSDVAAMKTALTNVSATQKAMEKLNTAVTAYGANSTQAQAAQKALNGQMKVLADSVGPKTAKAEANVAKQANALGDAWQHASSQAQFQGTKIMGQALHLGRTYVPLVAHAAAQNLAIINKDLRPLFAWLEGPHGIGIFNNLEKNFKQNLPSAIHALDQGVEFFLRVMNIASNYTGGFTKTLDRLFTRLNAAPDWKINDVVHKLVDDFRLWEHFVVILGKDIYELFRNDAQTGNSIISTLTQMLTKLHAWEVSTQGRRQLRNIFQVHKEEILALIHAFVPLAKAYGQFYMTVAPPLVRIVTAVARAFGDVIGWLDQLGPGGKVMGTAIAGVALLGVKFGWFKSVLTGVTTGLGKLLLGTGPIQKLIGVLTKMPVVGGLFSKIAESFKTTQTVAEMNVGVMKVGMDVPGAPGGIPGKVGGEAATASEAGMAARLASAAIPMISTAAILGVAYKIVSSRPLNHFMDSLFHPGHVSTKTTEGRSVLATSGTRAPYMDPFVQAANGAKNADHAVQHLNSTLGVSQQRFMQAQKTGDNFARNFAQAATETHSVTSKQVAQIIGEWQRLPPAARKEAGTAMIEQAAMLEKEGKLPKGATVKLMKFLYGTWQHGFRMMLAVTTANMKSIASQVQDGSSKARGYAKTQFGGLVGIITTAVRTGQINTGKAMTLINQVLNSALKALGQPGIPPFKMSAASAQSYLNWRTSGATGVFQPGAHARGGHVTKPAYIVGEEAPQHPEIVIASNPKYRKDNLKYWAHAGKMLGVPGFAAGGYVYPFPPGTSVGRTDMGVDANMPVGAPIGAIGPARILNIQPNWFAGQPAIWEQLTGGPMAGRIVYLAEQINPLVHAGQHVSAHQAIARYASHGTGIEMGWGAPGDRTLAQATSGYSEGQVTPAGVAFRSFLSGLAHGKIIGSGLGIMAMPQLQNIKLEGNDNPLQKIAQAGLNKTVAGANKLLQKAYAKAAAASLGTGNFSIASGLHGSVPRRIQQALRGIANKVGLAGVLGNAMQESGLNPASIGSGGGGLWGFTPLGPEQAFAAAHHRPWTDVGAQVAFMLSQGGGSAIAAANRAGSPAAAALAFMNLYERPGIPAAANREHYAQEAFAQGYAKGGVVNKDPWLAHWGKNYWSLWHNIHKLYPGMTRRQVGPYMHWLDTHHKGDERSRLLNNLYAQTALNQQSAMINAAMSDVFHPDALGHPLAFDRYVGAGRRHPRHMHHFPGMQLPAFGGVFHTGGIVPGAPGTERTIVAEAGERIGHDGEVCVYVVVKDGAVDARKIEATAQRVVDGAARRTATRVHRHLPSRGGGSLALQR